ncbi:tetratricopeptide repeat protein, partial [bacterium]|nr:tetratricopeptide repeat protein [bacterium]
FGGSYLDGRASYYRGIREVLEKLLEIDVAESRDVGRDKVAAFFATAHMKEEQAKVDGVVNFLRPESTAGPAPADAADTRQSSFFTDIALPLLRKAEKGPLLVYLENLHYAEEDSFRFLEHLLASLHDRPSKLLIVCMYDTHAKRDNPSLVAAIDRIARNYRTEVCHFVMLRRLTDDEMATLIAEMLGAPLDGQGTVLAMAEGNPHHAVEIVRYLHDRDLIVHKGDRWELTEFGDLLELVPTQLNTLIENRLNAIEATHPNGKHERSVLDWAALIGQRFSTELLERAIEKHDAQLAPQVLELLEHLVDDEEIFRSSEEFGANVLEFSQELMRRVIRAQIERKFTTPRKHRCIADTMLDLYASQVESIAHEVANHLMSAREDSRALQYLLMAARVARNGYNYADAQRHLKTALDILARSGDGADPNRQIDVMLDLGDVLVASSHFAEAIHYVQDALARSRDANDPRAEARSLLALGNAYVRRGDQADAQGRYAECKMLVDAHPLDELKPELLKGIANNLYRLGDLPTALATCDEWLRTYTSDDLLPLRAEVLRIQGYVLLWNFSLDKAFQNFSDGADLAKQLHDRQLLAHFYNNFGEIHRHQRHLDPAQELYTHSLQIREDIGDLSGVAMSRNNLGLTCKVRAEIAAANGDPATAVSHYHEARRWFDRAIKLAAEIGDDHRKADSLNNLATLCRLDNQLREALAHYNEAHRLYSKGKMKNELAIVEANLAMMAHLQGDDTAALAKYRDSARRFDDAGNSAYASYVYHNLALLSQRLGETDAVPRLLERKAQGMVDHPTYPWPAELQADSPAELVDVPDI